MGCVPGLLIAERVQCNVRTTQAWCVQAFTLTEGPAITSLAVSPDGAHLIAHLVSHTLQLWPLSTVLQRLDAAPAIDTLPPGENPPPYMPPSLGG